MNHILPTGPKGRSLIISCSPRAGGNCETAADFFMRSSARHSPDVQPVVCLLREFHVSGCTGCGACALWAREFSSSRRDELFERIQTGSEPFLGCPLSIKDDSRALLQALASAEKLCVIAPIYFYHLPSRFKALLDRFQPFWHLRQEGVDIFSHERSCKIILMGARKKGDHLFKGSILTLKYSLELLRFRLCEPLLLYGLDAPGDLPADRDAMLRIAAYAET